MDRARYQGATNLKIAAISDIHIREDGSDDKLVEAIHARVEELSPDIFVIAGDISEKIDHFSEILSRLHVQGCENLYVAGNHDIWFEEEKNLGSLEKYAKSVGAACTDNGFIHLPDTPHVHGKTAFVGSIGWSDYSFRREDLNIPEEVYESKQYGNAVWRDLYCIDWEFTDKEATAIMNEKLEHDLKTINADVEQVVFVSHHLPFRDLTLYKDYLPWDFFSAFMGATSTGEILLKDGRVVLSISGHSHIRNQIGIGDTMAITVPLGYGRPPPSEIPDFIQQAVAVIDINGPDIDLTHFVEGDICEGMQYTH
ncbi:MAG: metallophosphoesterase family protein [Candidatus Thorarchaeota archaeon]